MKITEITWENGKKYKSKYEYIWQVDCGDLVDEEGESITKSYTLKELLKLELEEFIDWSKVEVDTPIWVKLVCLSGWSPRHFSKFENGKVYYWSYGQTSHTVGCNICVDVCNASLTKPKED